MRLDFCVLCGDRESLEHHKIANVSNEITMCRDCYDKVRGNTPAPSNRTPAPPNRDFTGGPMGGEFEDYDDREWRRERAERYLGGEGFCIDIDEWLRR